MGRVASSDRSIDRITTVEAPEAELAEALADLRATVEVELEHCVGGLRPGGASWADVAALLGMTRQSAQGRFGPGSGARILRVRAVPPQGHLRRHG